jgi:MFS family permease
MVMFATTNTFTPEIAVSLGAGATELGYLATVSSLPAMFAAMLLGWLFRRRVNFKALIAISFILQIAGTLLSARAWSMAALYAASLILNFGTAICFTSLLSHCTLTIPAEKRGGAMGFFAAVYSIGMYGGPVLIGVLADAFGMVGGFTLFTAVPIIGLALTLALIKRADA